MGMYPKMVVFCHEAVTGLWKVWVDNCTSALGCSARRLPCLVSVWTAWHTTSSKWGIFLEVSSLYVFIFTFFLKSFGHGFGHNCNKVLGVNFQCPCNIFFFLCMFCFVTAFNSALIGLFQCSTTNWPVWICLPNLTYPGKSTRAKSFFFLLPKKYTRTSPFPFFSPFLSRLLFLDCFTICCSECL